MPASRALRGPGRPIRLHGNVSPQPGRIARNAAEASQPAAIAIASDISPYQNGRSIAKRYSQRSSPTLRTRIGAWSLSITRPSRTRKMRAR